MKHVTALAILGLTASSALAQTNSEVGLTPLGPNSALLSLTAEGESRQVPDLAMFSAGVVTTAATASEALGENGARMDRVVAALKKGGISERDIRTSAISLQPRYNDPEREARELARQNRQPYVPPTGPAKIIGYEARNTVQVRVRQLSEMGKIIDMLVAAGANQVNGPTFTLDEPRAAQDEARKEAVALGRERAELYARETGMRVARIISIREAGGRYPVRDAIVVSGYRSGVAAPAPPTPVSPGELGITVNISMQFELTR
ncbi:MAG: SIMPL domain-containing protein [Sphingomonas sp.]|nr:SIMPL domain-containing protein [Sphingomonas sp.]